MPDLVAWLEKNNGVKASNLSSYFTGALENVWPVPLA